MTLPALKYEVSLVQVSFHLPFCAQYFVFEQRMTMCLRLSCPLPVIGQLELM